MLNRTAFLKSKRIHVRLRSDLVAKLDKMARKEMRTRSKQLERLIEAAA